MRSGATALLGIVVTIAAASHPRTAAAQDCLGYPNQGQFTVSTDVVHLDSPRIVRGRIAREMAPRIVAAAEAAYDFRDADHDPTWSDPRGAYGGGLSLIHNAASQGPPICTFVGVRASTMEREHAAFDPFLGAVRQIRLSRQGQTAFAGVGVGRRERVADRWEIDPYGVGTLAALRVIRTHECVAACDPAESRWTDAGELSFRAEIEGGVVITFGRAYGGAGLTWAGGKREPLRPSPRDFERSAMVVTARFGVRI